MVLSFKKFLSSISFFLKKVIFLWEEKELSEQNMRTLGTITSSDMLVFGNKVIIASNDSTLQCRLHLNLSFIR